MTLRTGDDFPIASSRDTVDEQKTQARKRNQTIIMSTHKEEQEEEASPSPPVSRPYSRWYHPHMSWLDLFANLVMPFFLPLHRLDHSRSAAHFRDHGGGGSDDENGNDNGNDAKSETKRVYRELFDAVAAGDLSSTRRHMASWNELVVAPNSNADVTDNPGEDGDKIVESECRVKRQSRVDVWNTWDMDLDAAGASSLPQPPTDAGDILVRLYYPASLLLPAKATAAEQQPTEASSTPSPAGLPVVALAGGLEQLHWTTTPNVPLVVCLHGGGLTLGTSHAGEMAGFVVQMLQQQQLSSNEDSKKRQTPKRVVVASIEYSLAPDHPFPAAVEDVLTCLDHFVQILPNRHPMHLAGTSAGGNLAAVAALEMVRRYHGGENPLRSTLLVSPMIDPAADSTSYQANANTYLSVDWLRWCWRAYLQLDDNDSATDQHSNAKAWKASPFSGSPLQRWICPSPANFPRSLDENALTFLVVTNRADPLCTDGCQLAEALRTAGARVQHYDHGGSHVIGTLLDAAASRALAQDWSQAVFSAEAL